MRGAIRQRARKIINLFHKSDVKGKRFIRLYVYKRTSITFAWPRKTNLGHCPGSRLRLICLTVLHFVGTSEKERVDALPPRGATLINMTVIAGYKCRRYTPQAEDEVKLKGNWFCCILLSWGEREGGKERRRQPDCEK